MSTTTIPAIYVGSLVEFHGPVEVGLDPNGSRIHGDLRFYAWTPDGELLRQVRVTSLSFTAPPPTPVYRVNAREVLPAVAIGR